MIPGNNKTNATMYCGRCDADRFSHDIVKYRFGIFPVFYNNITRLRHNVVILLVYWYMNSAHSILSIGPLVHLTRGPEAP